MIENVQQCVAPNQRVLLVFGSGRRDYLNLIDSRKLHHEIASQGSRWYIARTERNIIYLNNSKIEKDTPYNKYPLFKERHKILEDQIPSIEEWVYLPSPALLSKRS